MSIADMMAIVPLRTWFFWVFICFLALAVMGFLSYYQLRKDNQRIMALIITKGRSNDTN